MTTAAEALDIDLDLLLAAEEAWTNYRRRLAATATDESFFGDAALLASWGAQVVT